MAQRFEEYQEKCFCIFLTTWTTHKSVKITSQVLLTTFTEVQRPSSRAYLNHTLLALHRYATIDPTSIDFRLRVYDNFCKLLPETVKIDFNRGEKVGRMQLRLWLVGLTNRWDSSHEHTVGHADSADKSIIRFSEYEVNSRTEEVLARVEEWRESRTHFIISMAIMGRCYALDILREEGGNLAVESISAAFTRHDRWTQAHFIGNCLLLRGCAKTLSGLVVDGAAKIELWGLNLRAFLFEENNSGHSYHAVRALCNVVEGPSDESSERLFESALWVF